MTTPRLITYVDCSMYFMRSVISMATQLGSPTPMTHPHHPTTCVDWSMYSMRSAMEGSSRSGIAISMATRPVHTALRTAGEGSCASVNSPCRNLQQQPVQQAQRDLACLVA